MGAVNTNSFSLAVMRELVAGQVPTTGEAEYLEPNEVTTFGAEITTIARQPISKYRMAKKGTITDISSAVEFGQDTTASLLLNLLEGCIYSHWLRRPYNVRNNVGVLGVGKNTVPNYRGVYAGIDEALVEITNPVAGNWWNNTVDNKEWEYDGTTVPAPHYRGSFASVQAALAGITDPAVGDWWNNTTDNIEYDYVGKTIPDPNYIGQFTSPEAATNSVTEPKAGMWWDNLSDAKEWVYDGTENAAPGYRGSYADATAANAAIKDPKVGDWFNNTTDGNEWNCTGVGPATGYMGEFASADDITETPTAGSWFNNTTTNTEWDYTMTTPEGGGEPVGSWVDSNNPTTTRPTQTATWEDSGNANGTRDTIETIWWKDSGLVVGTTSKTITQIWEATTRPANTTPTTSTTWWKVTNRAAFTTPTEQVYSAGGYNMVKPLAGALVPGTLLFARGFTHEQNNGLKVVAETPTSTANLVYVTDMGLVGENGNTDTSVFVCGFQANAGDIRMDSDGNLTSTTLNFNDLGIEPHSGIFIGGLAPATRFATKQDYGLCRVASVEAHKLVLDKRPNEFVADRGVGKTIHIYTGWFIRDVPVDDPLFKEHTFTFEGTYPGIQENNGDGYEYAVGNLINTTEISLPLTDKSVTTIGTFGLDVQPMTATPQNWERVRPIFQEAYSTPNDFVRLRLERADGYGLSTLFKECTLSLNNNAGGENVLGKLGPAFTNYGNFDVTLSFQCVFTNPDIPKMIRNNCTTTIDFCIANNDGAFWFDVPAMTLGGGDRDFTANEKVKINLTSNAFGDPNPGYTLGVTFFPYLPNPKADACA